MEKHQWTASGRLWVSLGRVWESASQKLIGTADMMQQIANDINKMKRSLLIDSTIAVPWRLSWAQVIACKGSPEVGSPLRIRHPTTTSRARSIKMELQRGSAKEASSPSGTRRASCCGSMENVGFYYWPCDNPDSFPSL